MWSKSRKSRVQPISTSAELSSRIDVEFIPASIPEASRRYAWNAVPIARDPDHQHRLDTLLELKHDLVEEYSERAFLLRTYLPRTEGAVLDVGVNRPNAHDSMALPDPDAHWTIDIDPATAIYGSGRHQTIDFFEFQPPLLFRHIIMFGLIGTPNNRTESDAHIGFDLNERLITHAASMLAEGGELLLGPELSGESRQAADHDVAEWLGWFERSSALVGQFELLYAMRGRCNLIAVFRKVG